MNDRDGEGPDGEGRVAVVTGGSRGMGREICSDFARRGFRVVIASRKAAACEELARELCERYAADAVGLSCHVGHWAECGSLIELHHGSDHQGGRRAHLGVRVSPRG